MHSPRLVQLTLRAIAIGTMLGGTAVIAAAQDVARDANVVVEKSTLTRAREEPQLMLKGIALNAMEQKAANDIERRYAREFKALEKQFNAALKAGQRNAPVFAKVEALRSRQRAEIRGMLTTDQQAAFDNNMAGR